MRLPSGLRSFLPLLVALVLVTAGGARAAEPTSEGARATVDLSAEASRPAPNDQAIATLYAQADDKTPAALARQVNALISAALEQARAYPTVSTRSAGANTFPVYGREGRRIESWRMRSEIRLESRDLPALSELVGKLQANLALASLTMQPAPETRKAVADQAAKDAIQAFQERAGAVAGTLGKPWRIRHLSVGYGAPAQPVFPGVRTMAAMAEGAPIAVEAGQTEIAVTVNGTIELTD